MATDDPGKISLWVHPGITLDICNQWFDAAYWRRQNALTGQATGRGTTYFINHQGQQMVLRHYRRGGLIGKLLSDQFLFTGLENTRPWQEAKLLKHMLDAGLNVPVPLAARVIKQGAIYRADILMSRIDGAKDIHQLLLQGPLEGSVWRDIGEAIGKMHNTQVHHHDLNIHNIMRDEEGRIWLIDFDKCRLRQGDSWKQDNLERLQRSINKESAKHPGYHADNDIWQQLLQGYQEEVSLGRDS